MAAAVAVTPSSGVLATKTVCRVDVTGSDTNQTASFSTAIYPTEPEIRYYIAFEKGGTEYGRSQVFGTTPVGAFQFNGYIFPSTGSWTVNLRNATSNASVATAAVTVA